MIVTREDLENHDIASLPYFQSYLNRWDRGGDLTIEVDGLDSSLVNGLELYLGILRGDIKTLQPEEDDDIHDMVNDILSAHQYLSDEALPPSVAFVLGQTYYAYDHPSDDWYEAWLKQTPEIYNHIKDQEAERNRKKPIELKSMYEYPLKIAKENPYKNYLMTVYPVHLSDFERHYDTVKPDRIAKFNHYYYKIKPPKEHPVNLRNLLVKNVAICGGFADGYARNQPTKGQDIDLFIYGIEPREIPNKVKEIVTQAMKYIPKMIKFEIQDYTNAISIIIISYTEDNESTMTTVIQIIKRLYHSLEEILIGFDLDSSAVALIGKDKKIDIVYHDRYAMAVKYGMNIINPTRQSLTYNHRLIKNYYRGYAPFMPGRVHIESPVYMKKIINPYTIYDKHYCSYLISQIMGKFNSYINDMILPDNMQQSDYATFSFLEEHMSSNEYDVQKLREELLSGQKTVRRTVFTSASEEIDMNNEEKNEVLRTAKEYGKFFNFSENGVWFMHFIKPIQPTQRRSDLLTTSYSHRMPLNMVFISEILTLAKVFENWKVTDPGTQISGSFNPVNYDYFSA